MFIECIVEDGGNESLYTTKGVDVAMSDHVV